MPSKRKGINWKRWRRFPSVRERLSSLVRRTWGKKTRSEQGKSDKTRVQDDLGPPSLDVDFQMLRSLRISGSWIELEPRDETEQQQRQRSSRTPIADMFAKKLDSFTETSSPSCGGCGSGKPVEVSASKSPTRHDCPNHIHATNPAPSPSIAKSGNRPGETPKACEPPEPPREVEVEVIRIRLSTTEEPNQPVKAPARHVQRPLRASSNLQHEILSDDSTAIAPTPGLIGNSRGSANNATRQRVSHQTDSKRHSMPIAGPSLAAIQNSLISRSSSAASALDRKRLPQPLQTSVLSRVAGLSSPVVPPVQRASARLATGRLAWIQELDEGVPKKPIGNSEFPVLKKMQGGVADKLAKFESKQHQLLPLTRSNSMVSRASSVADTAYASSYGGVTTARSSIDSHRSSSVFSVPDDSLGRKMGLAPGNSTPVADQDMPQRSNLVRVTAKFVPVDK